MAEVPVERRFRGSVRLATLHLWRVAKSTDLERCFKEARDLRMINQENEDRAYAFRINGQVIRTHMPARTISTFVIE